MERLLRLRDVGNCLLLAVLAMLAIGTYSWYHATGSLATPLYRPVANIKPQYAFVAADPYRIARATRPEERAAPWKPEVYSVHPGDDLSTIAKHMYGRSDTWTVIYWANKHAIKYANLIYPGQPLSIPALPAKIPAPPTVMSPVVVTVAVSSHAGTPQHTPVNGDGDSDSDALITSHSNGAPAPAPVTGGNGYAVSSSFQACVIRAESGGNPQIWNASGHWGLYQFSYSTWVGHGGAPSLFGHAGGAYQTQIFWNTVHADGTSDWAPYDGC